MTETKKINQVSAKEKWVSYLHHPMALVEFLLVHLAAIITAAVVLFLIAYVLITGVPHIHKELFAWTWTTENQSMMPAFVNTLVMTLLSLLIAVPIGVCAAIYTVEYAKRGNKLVKLVRLTAETLQGIPSIVYGIFGYVFFNVALHFGFSMLSGALTLSIMILPLILRTTEEALMAVPDSYREGSFGLGAGKLRTVFRAVLPSAVPGILSGVILSIGRIVGETAALIFTAGTVAAVPKVNAGIKGFFGSSVRTLSVHMYNLSKEGLHTDQAFATAVVLLVFVIVINFISNILANKLKSKV